MTGLFSRLKKDAKSRKNTNADFLDQQPAQPQWTDAWARTTVEPEEIHELVKRCTEEIRSRGMPSILRVWSLQAALHLPHASGHLSLSAGALVRRPPSNRLVSQKLIPTLDVQPSITLSYSYRFDRPPIPAVCVRSYATSSTTMNFAVRHWCRSCG